MPWGDIRVCAVPNITVRQRGISNLAAAPTTRHVGTPVALICAEGSPREHEEAIMNKRRFCDRSRGAATAQLLLLLLLFMLPPPPSALASEESANASTEAAGQRARFMQDFCGTSPEAIAQYKEKLAKVLTEASDFDTRWQSGWRLGERDALQLRALQLNSPAEFATRVKNNCERVRWQAANSLRPRAPR
jgi:hypothetical protein